MEKEVITSLEEAQEAEEKRKKKEAQYKSITKRYYQLPEEEMQALVKRVQEGDPEATEQILKIFENFFMKYVSLLYYGRYDLRDYDLRQFIKLWLYQKKYIKYLNVKNMHPNTMSDIKQSINKIVFMVKRYNDIEDVIHTCQMALLSSIKRYERRGEVPFSAFLYNYYFYALKKEVQVFLIDQLGRKTFPLIDSPSESGVDNTDRLRFAMETPTVDLDAETESLSSSGGIDARWVEGMTTEFPFSELDEDQRQLLKWRFIDGLTLAEISQRRLQKTTDVKRELAEITEILDKLRE